jgi:hypothetical protein
LIAYKTLAGNGMGDEDRRRSLLGHAKPKEMGTGIWSWWFDPDSGALGENMEPPLLPKPYDSTSHEDCLVACNDNSACAAVALTFVSNSMKQLASANGCVFKKGLMTLPSLASGDENSSKRSMIRYRTDAIYQKYGYRPPAAA